MSDETRNTVAVIVTVIVGIAAVSAQIYGSLLSRRGTKKYLESL